MIINTDNIPKDKKTILIIEDDQDLNDLICDELKDAGYTMFSAIKGKQGLNLAREIIPDLILMDVMLPDTTGIAVCREMSNDEMLKEIPVIISTSRFDLNTRLSSYVSGARRYIAKPFLMEELLEELEFIFNRHCST